MALFGIGTFPRGNHDENQAGEGRGQGGNRLLNLPGDRFSPSEINTSTRPAMVERSWAELCGKLGEAGFRRRAVLLAR